MICIQLSVCYSFCFCTAAHSSHHKNNKCTLCMSDGCNTLAFVAVKKVHMKNGKTHTKKQKNAQKRVTSNKMEKAKTMTYRQLEKLC